MRIAFLLFLLREPAETFACGTYKERTNSLLHAPRETPARKMFDGIEQI
ncbi:protein of unknown function [Methylocaldum szegediense]|uniref:Uncharacterized protein n=1 Tax=Methylocaldum szegediense TaxID=73780 RepID=A0ABM9I8L9_9GAMM|nr:protein of unknown function [Methylocaldum szegediense]